MTLHNECDIIVYLGDFFDKSYLNAEEISALTEIHMSTDKPHYFLCGNHEMLTHTGEFNSIDIFKSRSNMIVINKPTVINYQGTDLCFLPYIFESDRLDSIQDYFGNVENRIVFSHNDIKNVQMGRFMSKEGFDLEDLKSNCKMFFNGHLHNGLWLSNNVLNVGNLTGQNFSEDAFSYGHHVYVYDTETQDTQAIINPYAINFYKLDYNQLSNYSKGLFKDNAVISVSCTLSEVTNARKILDDISLEYKITIIPDIETNSDNNVKLEVVNHLEEFSNFILTELGSSDVVKYELNEVCK